MSVSTVSEGTRVARKFYVCGVCSLRIDKGAKHFASVNSDGESIWTWRAHERCVEVADHNARVAWCDFDEMCFNWFDFIEGHTSECEAAWYVKTGPQPDDWGVDEKRCTCGKATS